MAVYESLRGGEMEMDVQAPKNEASSRVTEEASLMEDMRSLSPGPDEATPTERTGKPRQSWLLSTPKRRFNSNCTLSEGRRHGWKPLSTSGSILVAFALCSLLFAAALEILAQISRRRGGLAVVDDAQAMPLGTTFSALFLPIIIAVIYSLAWNWVDLDIKRMQPWLELSKDGGATGENSVFLDYPFDFVAFVPFRAAKKRHWPAFFSGTIMILIFWLITPLQSSIFGVGPVLDHRDTHIVQPSKLLELSAQAAELNQAIAINAYAIAFLGQPYPGFSTAEYSLLPFLPVDFSSASANVGNWTGTTTKYWAEAECWPAEIAKNDSSNELMFDSGRGYHTSFNPGYAPNASRRYAMRYIKGADFDWQDNSRDINRDTPFFLSWSNTTLQTEHSGPTDFLEQAAIFCEPKYYRQSVSATVRASDLRPIDDLTKPLSDPEMLSDSEFNSSAFAPTFTGGSIARSDWLHAIPIALGPRMEDEGKITGLTDLDGLSSVIGFAIKGQNYTVDQYSDSSKLIEAMIPVHKSHFALAIQHILTNNTNLSQSAGEVNFDKFGIVINRVFSAIVEGLLCLVAVLTLLLYWTYRQSPSMLSQDPGWLGDLMGVIQHSEAVLDFFSNKGHLSDEKLLQACGSCRFQLICGCQDTSGHTILRVLDEGSKDRDSVQIESARSGHYSPISPLSLRRPVGATFAFLLCAVVVIIAVTKEREVSLRGLKPPSSSLEVNLIVLNFIPTGFATLVEPFWVLLSRLVGIFQPFHDLISGNPKERSAQQCMKARYTALPAQLALWPALQAKHFLLATVSIVALLANVLAVGLGALYNELPVEVSTPVQLTFFRDTTVSNESLDQFYRAIYFTEKGVTLPGSYGDPLYVAYSNLTSGTPFQPWTTGEFVFVPAITSSDPIAEDELYSVVTTGIGADPLCQTLGPVIITEEDRSMTIPSGVSSGSDGACNANFTLPSMTSADGLKEPAAYESSAGQVSGNTFVEGSRCSQTFVMGWSRAINITAGTMNSSFVTCRPVLKTAEFRVSFDFNGFIHKATPLTDFVPWVPLKDADVAADLVAAINLQTLSGIPTRWHNTTGPSDWMNNLIQSYMGSNSFLDPTSPTPDPEEMMPALIAVYKMIMASYLGLNQDLFLQMERPSTVPGTRTATQTRVFLSQSGLIVTLVILVLYVLVAIILYVRRTKPLLPRMPTTIGSLIAYVAPSRVLRDYSSGGLQKDATLGFGRYVGSDGRTHIGIEYADRVVPVDRRTLSLGDTKPPKLGTVSRLWRRKRTKTQGEENLL